MQTNPESAAVEAVAWQLRVLHKPFLRADMRWSKWQACSEEEFDAVQRGDPYCEYETVESRALYPQSALDALRGEVEDLKSQLAREEHSHGQTIDDRDRAEEALGDMFMAVTGREAEWSSAWDYADAIQEVEEHMSTLTKESP